MLLYILVSAYDSWKVRIEAKYLSEFYFCISSSFSRNDLSVSGFRTRYFIRE